MVVKRFSVWLVDLNPVTGSEPAGTRPILVISPDVMNARLKTLMGDLDELYHAQLFINLGAIFSE